MSVVGVDLGYQNSCIAVAGKGGVDVVMNGSAKRLNPYVTFREKKIYLVDLSLYMYILSLLCSSLLFDLLFLLLKQNHGWL